MKYQKQFKNDLSNSNIQLDNKMNSQTDSNTALYISNNLKESSSDKEIICWGLTSLSLVITLSDSMHNLLDGVAIGISFSKGISR